MPYGDISVSPAAPVFQYASGLFEGMKAYRCARDPTQVRLFRPDMNMARMQRSAARAALPTFDPEEMITLLRKLVSLDKDFVPAAEGHTLYLRPTLIGVSCRREGEMQIGAEIDICAQLRCRLQTRSGWACRQKPSYTAS